MTQITARASADTNTAANADANANTDRAFVASSRLSRTVSAAAALLCTVLVLSSVVGLALHYEHSAPMQSAAAPVTPAMTTTPA
jgi:hypothetical protein